MQDGDRVKVYRGGRTSGSPYIYNVTDATKSDVALRHVLGTLGKRRLCKTHTRILQLCSALGMVPDVGPKVMEQQEKLFAHQKAQPTEKDNRNWGCSVQRYNPEIIRLHDPTGSQLHHY